MSCILCFKCSIPSVGQSIPICITSFVASVGGHSQMVKYGLSKLRIQFMSSCYHLSLGVQVYIIFGVGWKREQGRCMCGSSAAAGVRAFCILFLLTSIPIFLCTQVKCLVSSLFAVGRGRCAKCAYARPRCGTTSRGCTRSWLRRARLTTRCTFLEA